MPSESLLQLNGRIRRSVRKQFDLAVAAKGISKQKAIEEAIGDWINKGERHLPRVEEDFPLIRARGKRKINPTKEQLDEAMFG